MKKVCIIPRMEAGGPGSFRRNLEAGLTRRNISVTHDPTELDIDAVLIINLVPSLRSLHTIVRSGVPVVQRLGSPYILNSYLGETLYRKARSVAIRWLTAFTRRHIAHHVVYQSRFVKDRWDSLFGRVNKSVSVIYNGADINTFKPGTPRIAPDGRVTILSVEGSQGVDPFDIAISCGRELYRRRNDFEIVMAGKARRNIMQRVQQYPFIRFIGEIQRDELLEYYRRADVFLSTDIIGVGCPNSVIEALACGVPVVGYQVGVLPEVVSSDAGFCVPAEGDPWKGECPGNVKAMADAIERMMKMSDTLHAGARCIAERRYSLDCMVEEYVRILFE